jgi:hypothetical protein
VAEHPGLIGLSIAIYDPAQDADRTGAQTINALVGQFAQALAG